jgi:hypothetical protein
MSREELSTMLAELADDVTHPPLARRAWAQARRVRRRRVAVGATVVGATVAVLLASAPVVLSRLPDRSDAPATPITTATNGDTVRIDRVPATVDPDPGLSPYWPPTLEPPADAPTLSQSPLSHAVLLFQPRGSGPIYAYGEGSVNGGSGNGSFGWVRLDVQLAGTGDPATTPLDAGSLGPMGELAAFAQPDEYVVVDLRTGSVRRTPLPGLNDDVAWFPDGRHLLVSSPDRTWLVGLSIVVDPVAAPGAAVTPIVGDASGLTALTLAPPQGLTVRHYDDEGRAEVDHKAIDVSGVAPYRIETLTSRGWRYGELIVQAARGWNDRDTRDLLVVVDVGTGAVRHLLDVGSRDTDGCCGALGWQNSDVIVLRSKHDLLLWRLSTGEVTEVTDIRPGPLSLAPAGCGWKVTVEGATVTCMA